MAAIARTYVRAHYVVALLVAAIVGGYMLWLREHDARIRRDAEWQRGFYSLDSLWRENSAAHDRQMAKTDTVTRTVTRLLVAVNADSGWRHDTVYVTGDTTPRYAVPIPTVLRQDSTNAACSLLAIECKAERVAALDERDAARREIAALRAKPERSCTTPGLVTLGIGAGVGFFLRGKL